MIRRISAISLLALAACSGREAASPPPLEPARRDPTYERDIAPIIASSCKSCHVAGGIAPFPLQTFEDAAARADQIAVAVIRRTMPPFGVDNSGQCNLYRDARWLTDQEIGTI